MKNKKFAALILTHGRPTKVYTYKTLRKHGYTGPIIIVVDNEDKTISKYKEIYGDKVYVFNKLETSKTFDTGDNFDDRRAIVYARNASFNIAKYLGYEYFIQLDDDYTDFRYKIDKYGNYINKSEILNLDNIFDIMLEFFKNTNIKSVAMAQGGDFIGGKKGQQNNDWVLKRKCMNSFICCVNRQFKFVGRINEDVNTYTSTASRGDLFFTIPQIALSQKTTQSNSGGMTDLYLDSGTYVKSFYSVIYQPSSVVVALMGTKKKRLHHRVTWSNTVPCILDEKYKIN